MARKTFLILLAALLIVFTFTLVLRYFKPNSSFTTNLDTFPMRAGDWVGKKDALAPFLIEALKPDYIFSATYTNSRGDRIQLFFDYFTGENAARGVHSPRNCMPGSGWSIVKISDVNVDPNNSNIPASRFILNREKLSQVMDFWYVTRYGETSNDFVYKFYTMLSSLTIQPTDVAFIRLVGDNTPDGLKALEDFEKQFVVEIYNYMPFE